MVAANVAPPIPVLAPAPQHPMRNRSFQLLFAGSTISFFGDQFYFIALPWLVLQQTGSAIAMGTIMMVAAVPRTVLMLMGGAVTDRISPRKIMISTTWVRSICVAALAVLLWTHLLQTWQFYVLAILFGTADAFEAPAEAAFLPFVIKPDQLVPATSILQSRTQLMTILAPAPVGFIIKGLGVAWAFVIDSFSFLFLIAALIPLSDPPLTQLANKPILSSIWDGILYVVKDVPLRSLMLVAMSMNFCLSGPIALGLAYLAKTRFGSPTALGIMFSCFAAGSLGGSLLAGVWKIQRRGILMILASLVLSLLLGSLGMLNTRWTVSAVLLAMGITAGLTNVHIGAWIMQRIDAAVRGRVSSVLMLGSVGIIPISLGLAGLLIAVNLKFMYLLAASLMALVTLAAAMQKTVREIA